MSDFIRLPGSADEPINGDSIQKLEKKLNALNEGRPFFRYRLVLVDDGGRKVLTCRKLTWSELFGGGKSVSKGKTTTAKLTDITEFLRGLHNTFPDSLKSAVDRFLSKKIKSLTDSTNSKLQESALLVSKFQPSVLNDAELKHLMNEALENGGVEEAFTFFSKLSLDAKKSELSTIFFRLTEEQHAALEALPGIGADDIEEVLNERSEQYVESCLAAGNIEEAFSHFFDLPEDRQLEELKLPGGIVAHLTPEIIKAHREQFENLQRAGAIQLFPFLFPEEALYEKLQVILTQIDKGQLAARNLISELGEIAFADPEIRLKIEKRIVEVLTKAIESQVSFAVSSALDLIEKMNPDLLSSDGWLSLLQSAIKSKNEDLANRISSKMGSLLSDSSQYRSCLLTAVENKWKTVALNLLQKIPKEAFANDSAMLKALDPMIRELSSTELALLNGKIPSAILSQNNK